MVRDGDYLGLQLRRLRVMSAASGGQLRRAGVPLEPVPAQV